MIVSESLQIPIVGFLSTPNTLPTKMQFHDSEIDKAVLGKHGNMDWGDMNRAQLRSLNAFRARRGLRLFLNPIHPYTRLMHQNLPMVIPVDTTVFSKPSDWHEKAIATTFLFPRFESEQPLSADVIKFIQEARAKDQKITLLWSQYESKTRDAAKAIAAKLRGCSHVIYYNDYDSVTEAIWRNDSLLEIPSKGHSSTRFLEYADLVILPGTLVHTMEALRAGVPLIITGDTLRERFWGDCVAHIGVSPTNMVWSNSKHFAYKVAMAALDVLLNHAYAKKSKEVAAAMAQKREEDVLAGYDCNGVRHNVEALVNCLPGIVPFESKREGNAVLNTVVEVSHVHHRHKH